MALLQYGDGTAGQNVSCSCESILSVLHVMGKLFLVNLMVVFSLWYLPLSCDKTGLVFRIKICDLSFLKMLKWLLLLIQKFLMDVTSISCFLLV